MLNVTSIENKTVWEKFLLTHAGHALFQSWLWGEVQIKLGTKIWRLGFYDGDTLIGIAQVMKVGARRGTFLHVRHGPILIEQKKEYWKQILSYMVDLAHRAGAWFIRVGPLIENTQNNNVLFSTLGLRPSAIHAMDAEFCWTVDLTQSEEQLLAGMRKTTRYEIKHAQKLGVTVEQSTDPYDLDAFFRLYKETSGRHGFVPHQGIGEEFEVFAAENKAVLLLGKYQGNSIAGAIVLFYGNQGIYHHGASIFSKIPASYVVQWEAIREAKKRGMNVYNFWGIAPEDNINHPWRGITLFKKGFGGREIEYIHAHDLAVSPFYVIPRTIETIRRLSRGY
ncbi:peptidoglycan bridge formation glycyltransferase FemA/FemB family protein [Candidatus Gottesmanbacteria bacterium]|nr:peptidoglycan bridge formation glycyltransferase FemA/FemB family protein [Candidatus Gottesmanbacteria bacterium]